MRQAVRAVILNEGNLLVIHRNKFGQEYDTLPGGNIEIGETPEQALQREVYDESQVRISNLRLVFIEHCEHPYGDQLIFVCDHEPREQLELLPGSEEDVINRMGKNLYEPRWMPIRELENKPFVTEELKKHLLEALNGDWPETPVEFTSSR